MRITYVVALLCLGCGSRAAPPVTPVLPEGGDTPAQPAEPPKPPADGDHAGHAGHGPAITLATLAQGAVALPDLGTHSRAISSTSKEAKAFFDQGLRLTYGFNHDEAARSYARAAAIDPSCGICFWGASLVLGPNYNVPMLPDRAAAAWDALQKAKAQLATASPVEKALIEALGARYGGPAPLDPMAMQPFNEAFAAAMGKVAAQFPDDADVQVLHAESLMNVNPWRLWSLDGKAAAGTDVIVATLEAVLRKSPDHPGANHYYIHAIEASPRPDKGVAAADRLAKLMPGAGHVVHMPAHIYQRVGRYADASEHNRKAAEVDLAYIDSAKPFGYYPFYLGHNLGFLAYSTSMEGRRADSMQAARDSVKNLPRAVICLMPGMDFFAAVPYFTVVRFGAWDEALAEPRPEAKYQVLTALWLHARGMALAATGKLDDARAALTEMRAVGAALSPDVVADVTPARDLVAVAAAVVEARIADKEAKPEALALWKAAVALGDKLPYSEPADFFYPIRHYEGAALLAAGKAKDAEAVYREDLRRNPGNGWALFGLAQAQRAQKKVGEAKKTDKLFAAAWKRADIKLTSSAY